MELSLAQKREDYRILIRKQDKLKIQRRRRQRLISSLQELREDHHECLLKIISEYLDGSIIIEQLHSPTAVRLLPYLRHLISSPCSTPLKVLYLSLLADEIYFKPAVCTPEVIDYVNSVIRTVKYSAMVEERAFEKEFLCLLEAITNEVELPEVLNLKKFLITWCSGTTSLSVINSSIWQFPNIHKYPELYQVIQTGISSERNDISEAAARTIVTICRYSDYDDIDSIYRELPGIFTNLQNRIMDCPHTQRKQTYCEAIISLTKSYDTVVRDYALMGLGQLATDLIMNGIEGEISIGLRIFTNFSYVQDKSMNNYLLRDGYIISRGVWAQIGTFYKSLNTEHRKNIYTILSQMLVNLTYEELSQFRKLINLSFLEVLHYGLFNESNPFIIMNLVIILEVLLYYSECLKQINLVNTVALEIQKLGLFKRLEQIAISNESCKSTRQMCERILKRYCQM